MRLDFHLVKRVGIFDSNLNCLAEKSCLWQQTSPLILVPGVPVELDAGPLFPVEVVAADDVRLTHTLYLALLTG